jgi:hypothetical protein
MNFPESLRHHLFLNLIAYSFYIKYKRQTAPTPNSSEPQYIFHSPQTFEPCKTRSRKATMENRFKPKPYRSPNSVSKPILISMHKAAQSSNKFPTLTQSITNLSNPLSHKIKQKPTLPPQHQTPNSNLAPNYKLASSSISPFFPP